MDKSEFYFRCSNCKTGKVKVVKVKTSITITQTVNKCDNCKYQYGIKGLDSLKRY